MNIMYPRMNSMFPPSLVANITTGSTSRKIRKPDLIKQKDHGLTVGPIWIASASLQFAHPQKLPCLATHGGGTVMEGC